MPYYEFLCESCEYNFEVKLSFSESHPKDCPKCKKGKLNQVYDGNTIVCMKGGDTIGQVGEANYKKAGGKIKEYMAKKQELEDSKLPWWRSGKVNGLSKKDKPLNLSKIKNVKNYIETGEE
jgi:putative FmdB family regulatory protein